MHTFFLAQALFVFLAIAAPLENINRRTLAYPLDWAEVSQFQPMPPICEISCITTPAQSFCSRGECQNGINPGVIYAINEDTFFAGDALEICPAGSAQPGAICAQTGILNGNPADHVPLDINPADWS